MSSPLILSSPLRLKWKCDRCGQIDVVDVEPLVSESRFWELIATIDANALTDFDEATALRPLLNVLDRLSVDELYAFYAHIVVRLHRLDSKVIRSRCKNGNSSEGFVYHRLYVIGRGRKYYSEFLNQPHALESRDSFSCMYYSMNGLFEFQCENEIHGSFD